MTKRIIKCLTLAELLKDAFNIFVSFHPPDFEPQILGFFPIAATEDLSALKRLEISVLGKIEPNSALALALDIFRHFIGLASPSFIKQFDRHGQSFDKGY